MPAAVNHTYNTKSTPAVWWQVDPGNCRAPRTAYGRAALHQPPARLCCCPANLTEPAPDKTAGMPAPCQLAHLEQRRERGFVEDRGGARGCDVLKALLDGGHDLQPPRQGCTQRAAGQGKVGQTAQGRPGRADVRTLFSVTAPPCGGGGTSSSRCSTPTAASACEGAATRFQQAVPHGL